MLKRFVQTTAVAGLLLGTTFAGTALAASSADPLGGTNNANSAQTLPLPSITNLTLLATQIDENTSGAILGPGLNQIDSTIMNCTLPSGCTITFNTMVEVGGNSTSDNRWAICALVDGKTTRPGFGCPFQDDMLTDGDYQTRTSLQSKRVSFGFHTLTTQVYTDDGGVLGECELRYSLYQH